MTSSISMTCWVISSSVSKGGYTGQYDWYDKSPAKHWSPITNHPQGEQVMSLEAMDIEANEIAVQRRQTHGAFVWIVLNLESCVGCWEALHKLGPGSSSDKELRVRTLTRNSLSELLSAPSVSCILERHCSLVWAARVPRQALLETLKIFRLVRVNLDFMDPETYKNCLNGLL